MNIAELRKEFPLLKTTVRGHPLAYLDNAATTQKPSCVIESLSHYYSELNANVHRGVHHLSEKADTAFHQARGSVKKFLNAPSEKECIFVKGVTEGINLVASSFGDQFVKPGSEILISALEHHSNIVPWQLLCKRKGATLKVVPINEKGELELTAYDKLLNDKTVLVAITHASNAIGTINPLATLIQKAHAFNVPVLVDGAQSAPHLPIDVQALDCDFFVFSSHKTYGPTGIGVLYGKEKWLEKMPPYQSGGGMIRQVSFSDTEFEDLPHKFEAGTPAIAEAIALGAALDFLMRQDRKTLIAHEQNLLTLATEKLLCLPGTQIIGTAAEKIGVLSFTLEGIHPHDIATLVDQYGVAIRAGHHCAMPLMDFFKVPATARISFGLYNTEEEVEQFLMALNAARQLFKRQEKRNDG